MKKKKIGDIITNILLTIGIILCAFLLVMRIFFVKVVVSGNSMTPTILNGSKGYMVKVRNNTTIERFDVVAGSYNGSDDYYIIKRVLGLPNEQVSLVNNVLTVNGEVVEQNFTFNLKSGNFSATSWTLGENEYLLVGDNRIGTIEPVVENKDKIIAKNGFSYASYDVNDSSCIGSSDYSSCPIAARKWYWFKDGIV